MTDDSLQDDPLLLGLSTRYEVQARLGQGGMATVYRAWDRDAQADVALKVLHLHLRADVLVAERFRREVAAARRIDSPHVVTIYDLIEDPLALVMAYLPGVDLKRLIRRRGPLPAAEVARIAAQVLEGLAAAHRAGIVHRDVKPHNILVDEETERAWLTDFGLARVDDLISVTTHTMTLGTPEYMPPELLDGTLVDGRADLYSLGVTLYEAVTGKLPFVASTPMALLRMHETEAPPDPRARNGDVPEALALAIMKAMARDPDDRFTTADEMLAALHAPRPAGAPLPSANPCPNCAAPIPPGLSLCPECGHTSVRILDTGRHGWSVLIEKELVLLDTSNEEDTMTFQQKHTLIENLKKLGGALQEQGRDLDKRLRNPPLIAARHLSSEDARLIAAQLRTEGVPAVALKPGRWRRLYHFFRRSGAPGFAFIAFVATVIGVAVTEASPVGIALIGFVVLFVTAIAWFIHLTSVLSPLVVFSGVEGTQRDTSALSERARDIFQVIRSPRLRQLARRILTRGLALQDEIERRDDMEPGLARDVEEVMLRALNTVEQVANLEAELEARTPAEIHEELEVLAERMSAETDMAEVEEIIARRVELAEELAAQDARQVELARCASRLLETSAELTALRDRLHGAGWGDEDEQALSVILSNLDAEVEAREEVEALARA